MLRILRTSLQPIVESLLWPILDWNQRALMEQVVSSIPGIGLSDTYLYIISHICSDGYDYSSPFGGSLWVHMGLIKKLDLI